MKNMIFPSLGIPRNTVTKNLHFGDFLNCLFKGTQYSTGFHTLRHFQHQTFEVELRTFNKKNKIEKLISYFNKLTDASAEKSFDRDL